ncbi:selenocysteine-specific translation elongation factor [Testudinibacter sp. P80/BLE/0925]|uniref:selenocysteine-specific translation elongation factor n=1 Tax=Testudinibacter sp. TW-1 TaxID=3417757 RepID=UPI003D36166F
MIIVSAGHVDHGKTALIRALTGTDTTHLPEEKKRGMTIDLGYAYLPYGDQILGFIDVPGHERFLSNMLAGVGGVQYALLLVAADEGIKPQTEEHLAILNLLDFKEIIVVISKADKASAEQINQLQQQLKQRYPFLTQSAVFATSTVNGQGIGELKRYLFGLSQKNQASEKPFRYAIDRTFHIKGAGKVVTGTAFAGQVAIDDTLFLSSQLKQTIRVKNIHAQNQQNTHGVAGQRLALNLAADQLAITRGDWLFSHAQAQANDRITLLLNPIQALKASQAVHIYHAASHTVGKLTLLEQSAVETASMQQNEKVLAELILQQPLFLAFGDKVIVRSGDNQHTLAGASVLEIASPQRYKRQPARLAYLWQLAQAETQAQRISRYLQRGCVEQTALCWAEQLTETQFAELQTTLAFTALQGYVFNQDYRQQQQQKLVQALHLYHQQHPDQLGISKARLQRMAALKQPQSVIYHFIQTLLQQGDLAQTRGWIHLPDHKIAFTEEEQQLWQRTEAAFLAAQGQAVWVRDLAKLLAIDESVMRNFLYKAGKLGYLTAIIKDRFFLTETLYAYAERIKVHIEQHGAISVNELRDQLQFGRKMTVQLIEYFDKCGFLRRKGDQHLLRDADIFEQI